MLVVVYLEGGTSEEWRHRLQERLSGISCRTLDENPPAGSVMHAAVWQPPPGWLASFPSLRCVVSLAAGVDGILKDAIVPSGVPILRLAGEPLAARMREYVLLAVLALHRDLPRIYCDRRNRIWNDPVPRVASERTVGVMGLGVSEAIQLERCPMLDFA